MDYDDTLSYASVPSPSSRPPLTPFYAHIFLTPSPPPCPPSFPLPLYIPDTPERSQFETWPSYVKPCLDPLLTFQMSIGHCVPAAGFFQIIALSSCSQLEENSAFFAMNIPKVVGLVKRNRKTNKPI